MTFYALSRQRQKRCNELKHIPTIATGYSHFEIKAVNLASIATATLK
jgi:hypothetical protein